MGARKTGDLVLALAVLEWDEGIAVQAPASAIRPIPIANGP